MLAARPPPLAGIDRLLADADMVARLRRRRVGLLSNRACMTRDGAQTAHALARALGTGARGLVRLFAPEHGWSVAEGAGVGDGIEPGLGLPVHSLYGPRRAPAPEALDDLDAVIVDLQDVGVRCYTYATTAALVLATLAGRRVEAIVCDRPNPLGTRVAGPMLDPDLRSFVGYFDMPYRHGRTLGTLLGDFTSWRLDGKVELTVIPAGDEPLAPPGPWTPPSPALPDWEAVLLYPGLVLLEGTNVSEGRGTDAPFRSVAAPGLDGEALATHLNAVPETGVRASPTQYVPGSGKLVGKTCGGVRLEVPDPNTVDGLAFGVHVLAWLATRYADFAWTEATVPVADDSDPLQFTARQGFFIDYLLGDTGLRQAIGDGAAAILARWRD